MKDGEYILCEFPLEAVVRVAENQDRPAVRFGKPLENPKSEAGEPVPVGNHNAQFIPVMTWLR